MESLPCQLYEHVIALELIFSANEVNNIVLSLNDRTLEEEHKLEISFYSGHDPFCPDRLVRKEHSLTQ